MTVLLVLAMFATFLTIDYVRNRKSAARPAIAAEGMVSEPRRQGNYVSGFEVRENLRYHPGHTWALQESEKLVRAGLDDFAAKLVGKCDGMVLPKRGTWIRQGQKLLTIFRDGQKAEVVSPIEGEITDVNDALVAEPNAAVRDPYGTGWLVAVMSPDARTSFRNLLSGDVARRWMAEAASRLSGKMPTLAGAVAQDGGVAVADLSVELPGQNWQELTREFFLI